MKFIASTVIASGLLTVAVLSDPLVGRPPEPSKAAMASQAPITIAQTTIGECCNDDFRQALPLLETPADTVIAKP
jgi:hypothetical protein